MDELAQCERVDRIIQGRTEETKKTKKQKKKKKKKVDGASHGGSEEENEEDEEEEHVIVGGRRLEGLRQWHGDYCGSCRVESNRFSQDDRVNTTDSTTIN